jgi:hypothetical protein
VSDPEIRIKSVQKERVFIINVRNIIQGRVYITEDGLPETSKHAFRVETGEGI